MVVLAIVQYLESDDIERPYWNEQRRYVSYFAKGRWVIEKETKPCGGMITSLITHQINNRNASQKTMDIEI